MGKGSNPDIFVSQKSPKDEEQKVQVPIAVIRPFMFRSTHQVNSVDSFIVHFKSCASDQRVRCVSDREPVLQSRVWG